MYEGAYDTAIISIATWKGEANAILVIRGYWETRLSSMGKETYPFGSVKLPIATCADINTKFGPRRNENLPAMHCGCG
jgi:hypothetical protein